MSKLYREYEQAAQAVVTSELTGDAWWHLVSLRDAAAKRWTQSIVGNACTNVCAVEWAAAMRMSCRMNA
jgi:hypothetical protein